MIDHLLSIILLSPLAGALVLVFVPYKAFKTLRTVAIASAVPPLAGSVALLWLYDLGKGGFQFMETYAVVPKLGIQYHLAVDGL